MPTTMESVLAALHSAIAAAAPAGAFVARNAMLPERVPAAGILIVRDGDPGEPEFLFSPPVYFYEHRAEVDIVVDGAGEAARDAAFDTLKAAVGAALAADRTLGGLCDHALGEAPSPLELPIEGAEGLKAATIGVILQYAVSDPLAG